LQQVLRSLLDVLNQSVAMCRLPAQRLEDHHLECARKKIASWILSHRPVYYRPRVNKYQRSVVKKNLD
jgi:hypothetical protein